MELVMTTGRVLRLVAFLTVLGFLSVVLIGPVLILVVSVLGLVLTLLGAVLPFTLIGLLVWGVVVAISPNRRAAWQRLRSRAAALGHWVVVVPLAACVRLCAWGFGVGRALAPLAVPAARRAGEAARDGVEAGVALAGRAADAGAHVVTRAHSVARVVVSLLLEMVAGAAAGTILVCLADPGERGPHLGMRIAAGAAAGALLGVLVGAARSSLRTERG